MTARSGMANLIRRLRGLAQVGTADYTVAGFTWWADDQLQEVLDTYRLDLNRVPLGQSPEYEGGTPLYLDYVSPYGNLEEAASGTAVFAIEDADGDNVGTASYTADYVVGKFRFTTDQAGTEYYIRGRAYDLNRAAAQIWREKAAWRAQYVSFAADDQRFNQSEWFDHCMAMVRFYDQNSGASVVKMVRTDLS